jgi:branched-chain amino acid transport system permease protein
MALVTIKRNSKQHMAVRLLSFAILVLAVLWVPTRMATGNIDSMTNALALVIAASALNLVIGYTGLISIGHSAFFGIGSYATGVLVSKYGWGHGWSLIFGAGLAFVFGCIVALPALRIKGIYLALVTLAVAVLFPTMMKWPKLEWLTSGARGISGVRYDELPSLPFLGDLKGRDDRAVFFYWYAIMLVLITVLVCRGIVRSRVGRALIAIRDNEIGAEVMGVNLAATKTLVFGISAALTSLAGSLSVARTGVVTADGANLTLLGSIVFLVVMVVGGAATIAGPIIGAFVYVWVDNYTRTASASGEGLIGWLFDWSAISPASIILSVSLIALMFVAPDGVFGLLRRLVRKIVAIR